MAGVFEVGSGSVLATDTGTKQITLANGSLTPQLVLFWYRQASGTGTVTGDRYMGFGAMTSGQVAAITQHARDNVGTTIHRETITASGAILEVDNTGTETGRATFSAFAAGSFTLSIANQFAADCAFEYIAIGGLTNVFIKNSALPAATGTFAETGVGFQPDEMIIASCVATSLDSATTNGRFSLGFLDKNANQFSISYRLLNGTAGGTGASSGWTATNRVLTLCDTDGSSGQPQVMADDNTWPDADGYTLNRTQGTTAFRYFAVCMKGGNAVVGSTTTRTSTGNFDVATSGLDPGLVMLLCHPKTITSLTDATPRDGELAFGAGCSSTQRFAVWHHSPDLSATEEYSRVNRTRILENYDRTGVDTIGVIGEIDLVSVGTAKFTLNQVDADAQLSLLGFMALGSATAGGGGGTPYYLTQFRAA